MADGENKFPFTTQGEHELILGSSLNHNAKEQEYAFHTIRYDFKPASVDSTKSSELVVGEKSEVTITVPHIQDSGNTVYKGSKRPCPKEFLLIIDKKTQTFTLERIGSTSHLKKIRSANPVKNKMQASSSTSITPETKAPKNTKKLKPNSTKTKLNEPSLSFSQVPEALKVQTTEATELSENADSSSSSDSSSSDSENDDDDDDDEDDDEEFDDKHVEQLNSFLKFDSEPDKKPPEFNQLSEDLHLSESGSDSD